MPGFELIGKEEFNEIQEIFKNGAVLYRNGFEQQRNDCFKVRDFEKEFAKYLSIENSLAVTSGTAALRVALAALGIGEDDEVITQSFTFVATLEAIIESNATPVCTEIDNTLNMDPIDLEKKITPKTKAVIVVHMLGTPAKLKEIKDICKRYNLFLIEDTAWGCGGSLEDKKLGTWGDIGTFSFDFAKTITTGEGGMIVFKDKEIREKAAAWHDHGHENNPNFPRWEDTRSMSGFNFRMSELQGAIGLAQLKKLDYIVKKQRENKSFFWDQIKDINEVKLRTAPEGSYETCDALVFSLSDKKRALKCRLELNKLGMATKILPEAYTWHFAGSFFHMENFIKKDNFKLSQAFQKSREILDKTISIPIQVKMDYSKAVLLKSAIEESLLNG